MRARYPTQAGSKPLRPKVFRRPPKAPVALVLLTLVIVLTVPFVGLALS